jgi:hypothetical protein
MVCEEGVVMVCVGAVEERIGEEAREAGSEEEEAAGGWRRGHLGVGGLMLLFVWVS